MKPKILVVENFPLIEITIKEIICDEFEFHFASSVSAVKKFIQHITPEIVLVAGVCRLFTHNQKKLCFSELRDVKHLLPDTEFVFLYNHIFLTSCICIARDCSVDHVFEDTTNPRKIIKILRSVQTSPKIHPSAAKLNVLGRHLQIDH